VSEAHGVASLCSRDAMRAIWRFATKPAFQEDRNKSIAEAAVDHP
jgi:hypothetical protein